MKEVIGLYEIYLGITCLRMKCNIMSVHNVTEGKHRQYKENKILGPRIEPWGTPHVIEAKGHCN